MVDRAAPPGGATLVMDLDQILAAVRERVIGRDREVRLVLAALAAGRDLLLEGPPGTSKSTLLRAITQVEGRRLYFVEGNADLTPAKLVGHHSPSRVLQEGYGPDSFLPGPLPSAMRDGGFLYLEELNRVPEDTLNVLITAMAERELAVPRYGTVRAEDGFRVVAAMNPFDNVGTGRLSGALTDRLCRVRLAYQNEEEERRIVAGRAAGVDPLLVEVAVRAARLTRRHPEIRMGASVRAAIDFALIADRLAALRPADPLVEGLCARRSTAVAALVEAGQTALGIKIAVREGAAQTDDEMLRALVERALDEILGERGGGAPPAGPGGDAPGGSAPAPPGRAGHQGTLGHHGGVTPEGAATFGGVLLSRADARARARQRGDGERRFHAVAAEHPGVAAALDDPGLGIHGLEELLTEAPDPFALLGDLAALGDRPRLRDLARRLATEIIVRDARRTLGRRGGRGRLASARYRGDGGELDLERTLERILETPRLTDDDVRVLERREHRRSYALMLDVSGSMKGAKVFYAALALAAVAARTRAAPLCVVAFWRDAAVLKHLEEPLELAPLVDLVLSLSGRGLTDLRLGLQAGLAELEAAATEERVGILFSDGLQTAGAPAGPIAAAFPTLHVVGTDANDDSRRCCAELASLGRGRCAIVGDIDGIAPALSACLGS